MPPRFFPLTLLEWGVGPPGGRLRLPPLGGFLYNVLAVFAGALGYGSALFTPQLFLLFSSLCLSSLSRAYTHTHMYMYTCALEQVRAYAYA